MSARPAVGALLLFIAISAMGCDSTAGIESSDTSLTSTPFPLLASPSGERLGDRQPSQLDPDQLQMVTVRILSCEGDSAVVAVTNHNEFAVHVSVLVALQESFLYTTFPGWKDWPIEITNLQPTETQLWREVVSDPPVSPVCTTDPSDPCSCLLADHRGVRSGP